MGLNHKKLFLNKNLCVQEDLCLEKKGIYLQDWETSCSWSCGCWTAWFGFGGWGQLLDVSQRTFHWWPYLELGLLLVGSRLVDEQVLHQRTPNAHNSSSKMGLLGNWPGIEKCIDVRDLLDRPSQWLEMQHFDRFLGSRLMPVRAWTVGKGASSMGY